MPTMAKLFSAVLMGVLGYVVADLIGGHLPPEERQNALRPITAIFGVIVGWRFLGKRVRGEWAHAIGLGASAGAAVTICALIWFSGYEMLKRATRLAYGGDPVAALEDMMQIAVDYLQYFIEPDVAIVAVFGSVIVGGIVTAVSRVWP